jgi:hypothetical protein
LDEWHRGLLLLSLVWHQGVGAEAGHDGSERGQEEELPEAIGAIIEAVQAGELDAQIEASAERGTAELRQKVPVKPLRKAS